MEKHTTTEHDLNEEEIEVDPAVVFSSNQSLLTNLKLTFDES